MKFSLAAIGLLLVPSVASARLAPAELIVQGTITPGACLTAFAGGGAVDLGIISAGMLNETTNTPLPFKDVPFTVTCSGPTNVAFNVIDNRDGTAVDVSPHNNVFGLGLNLGSEKIGRALVGVVGVLVDGNPGRVLVSSDGGANWSIPANQRLSKWVDNGFADVSAGTARPPLTTATGKLRIMPEIARANSLTTTAGIAIDGSITMEMRYR